jgi:glycerate dehydrogenase
MRIVVLDGYTENPGDLSWEGFEALGNLTVYDRTPPAAGLTGDAHLIAERIGSAQAVITNKTPLSRQTIAACPAIKYIGELATGYNNIDVEAAKERRIPVCNIPAYGTQAVAQFAIALLLEICHRIGHHNDAVHAGRWQNCVDFCFWDFPLIELAGKTMGIIGYGRIGSAVGAVAQSLGMNVIACDEQTTGMQKTASYVPLDTLLARSDVISLHCPLFPSTQGIINKNTIAKMKDGVIIINNSRGPLIVEQDLADALNSGKVYGAGLDVVSSEPVKADNPLLHAKNCIITPHISWASKESRARLMNIAVENLKAFIAGKPVNVVNP